MAKNLEKIGVRLEITINTFPAYLEKSKKNNLVISKGGWNDDYPDPEINFQLLYGPNKPPGMNEANFDHPKFNRLYDKFAVMPPGATRRNIVCKMEEIVQEEVPWAYGIYEDEYRLIQPWLRNYQTAELVQNKYKYVDVDLEKKMLVAKGH